VKVGLRGPSPRKMLAARVLWRRAVQPPPAGQSAVGIVAEHWTIEGLGTLLEGARKVRSRIIMNPMPQAKCCGSFSRPRRRRRRADFGIACLLPCVTH
jgi:hypothetical protein